MTLISWIPAYWDVPISDLRPYMFHEHLNRPSWLTPTDNKRVADAFTLILTIIYSRIFIRDISLVEINRTLSVLLLACISSFVIKFHICSFFHLSYPDYHRVVNQSFLSTSKHASEWVQFLWISMKKMCKFGVTWWIIFTCTRNRLSSLPNSYPVSYRLLHIDLIFFPNHSGEINWFVEQSFRLFRSTRASNLISTNKWKKLGLVNFDKRRINWSENENSSDDLFQLLYCIHPLRTNTPTPCSPDHTEPVWQYSSLVK